MGLYAISDASGSNQLDMEMIIQVGQSYFILYIIMISILTSELDLTDVIYNQNLRSITLPLILVCLPRSDLALPLALDWCMMSEPHHHAPIAPPTGFDFKFRLFKTSWCSRVETWKM